MRKTLSRLERKLQWAIKTLILIAAAALIFWLTLPITRNSFWRPRLNVYELELFDTWKHIAPIPTIVVCAIVAGVIIARGRAKLYDVYEQQEKQEAQRRREENQARAPSARLEAFLMGLSETTSGDNIPTKTRKVFQDICELGSVVDKLYDEVKEVLLKASPITVDAVRRFCQMVLDKFTVTFIHEFNVSLDPMYGNWSIPPKIYETLSSMRDQLGVVLEEWERIPEVVTMGYRSKIGGVKTAIELYRSITPTESQPKRPIEVNLVTGTESDDQ